MKKSGVFTWLITAALFLAAFLPGAPAWAQASEPGRPIDMVIVLDNSCSMFPKEMLVAGCTTYGSDVAFLRITGADMFLARLGFDQANESEYQVGVISLGDEPKLVSPLGALADRRDELAALIANPKPETATRLVPALQLAYNELTTSPNRKEANLPAVVLITDGVPYPPEGQSNADIEKLIQQYPDIPVFLMILKGADSNLDEFDNYVTFWQAMQQKYDNVYVYLIDRADQIQDTYNTIVAMLQDTIPTKGSLVVPGKDLPFYVSKYIDKVVVTVSYPPGAQHGSLQVIDPRGQVVQEGEAGVGRFSGEQNPVEVISIAAPRLADAYKDQYWTIRTDWATNVFIDRLGSYGIQILSPDVLPLELKNVYLVSESQSPRQPFVFRFSLQGADGSPVLDPQPVPLASDVKPDENGVYEMRFDLPSIYPYVGNDFVRFVFVVHAGSAGENLLDAIPIASARLLVDIGPSPFIQLLNPAKIECSAEAAPKLQVSIGDAQSVISGTLTAIVSGPAGDIALSGQGGDLRGDLTGLCQGLLAQLACDEQSENTFTLKIDARLPEEHPFQAIERAIPVLVTASRCTPAPTQTESAFVLPTPRPTPLPDEDSDGFADTIDSCPGQPGLSLFNGCPTPIWVWIAGGIVCLGLAVFLGLYVWPRISIRYVSPPPDVYIAVTARDAAAPELFSVRQVGIQRRSPRVKVGGDKKKADIYVSGLRPVEFTIDVRGDKVVLVDAGKGETKATFRHLSADQVTTSNPGIRLWVAAKRSTLDSVMF
jgi:hypothetical protein